MKAIAFTGMPWAGKTEAVSVAKELGLPVIRMGDMVWEEVKRKGLTVNNENVSRVAEEMRKIHGRDIWAKKTLKKIKGGDFGEVIVIDGVRSLEEVKCFKSFFNKNFTIIAITAPEEVRRKRAVNRRRIDDTRDLEEIKKREEREKKWGVLEVVENADYIISNEGDLETFRTSIEVLLRKLIRDKF